MVFLIEGTMKKQIYRVIQLADQKFAGAEKTEMLNDDLVNKEKQVDILRSVCEKTCKQIRNCIQGQGTDGASIDKRLKKIPDFCLGSTMLECGGTLRESSILGQVLDLCGRVHCEMAQEVLKYEVEVEKLVLAKYIEILELDFPNIVKLRKQLTKLTLDYDSAKTRYQQIVKQSVQTPANKIDNMKQEYDDAKQKVESCKDTLASELYAVLAKETDLARCIQQLTSSQIEYHRRALEVLEKQIPTIDNAIQVSPGKPAYGVPLTEHLEAANTNIAVPIEKCICSLLENGLEEEGILRIAGSASKVKKLKNSFDVGVVDIQDYDPPAIAGAMKQYLRELPEPLMTFQLYDEWMEISKFPDRESKLEAIHRILPKLPTANYDNLRYLMKFLAKVASFQDVNKMSSQNIAIVIAINLIWAIDEEQLGMNMGLATTRSSIVDLLISHADDLFPGDENFGLSESLDSSLVKSDLTAPIADCDIEDEVTEVVEADSIPNPDPVIQERERLSSFNKTTGNGNSKESPKMVRRFKKQAPPVPPPPKESHEKSTIEKRSSQFQFPMDEKPVIPFKPRHARSSSGVSLDLSRPSSNTSASDIDVTSNCSSSKDDHSLPTEDEIISEPILRPNFRASLPFFSKPSEDVDKTTTFKSLTSTSALLKDRSKSSNELSTDDNDTKELSEQKQPSETPTLRKENTSVDVGEHLNGRKSVHGHGNMAPPERPPRPHTMFTVIHQSNEKEANNYSLNNNAPPAQSRLKPESDSLLSPKNEINKRYSARNAYVNLPPNFEALKSKEASLVDVVKRQEGNSPATDDSDESSSPPERPKKFDKSKNVPPARPEKSDKLKALLDTKHKVSGKSRVEESLNKSSAVGSSVKEKPSRPPPCIINSEKEKPIPSAPVTSPVQTENLYPDLTDLELSNAEIEANMLKSTALSAIAVSPGPPQRPPRPPTQARSTPPVAKPRTIIGTVPPNQEHTHL